MLSIKGLYDVMYDRRFILPSKKNDLCFGWFIIYTGNFIFKEQFFHGTKFYENAFGLVFVDG